MSTSGTEPDEDRYETLLARVLCSDERLDALAVGVSDVEPWRPVGVAVTDRRVVWLDVNVSSAVSVTRDAVVRVAFIAYDAPPRPVYFDVEIDNDAGVVSGPQTASAPHHAVGSARSALVHAWIDTVRFTTDDAKRLEQFFLHAVTDDGRGRDLGSGEERYVTTGDPHR
jgi:hypothetical protein